MTQSISRQWNSIVREAKAAGSPVPTKILDEFAAVEAMAKSMETHADRVQVADTVADCLANGKDPLTDPNVQRILNAKTLGEALAHNVLGDWVITKRDDIMRQHADALFTAWAKRSKVLGDKITKAMAVLGDMPLEDADLIVRKGPDHANAWHDVTTATEQFECLGRAWNLVALGFASGANSPKSRLLRLCPDITAQQVHAIDIDTPLRDLVRTHGLTIALPTLKEWKQREATYREQAQAIAEKRAVQSTKQRAQEPVGIGMGVRA